MFDRRLDETWVLRYRQGLLSAEDEQWTESCYDSEQSVRELFGQLRVEPLHLRGEAEAEDAEPEVSDAELLERIDGGLRRLEDLLAVEKPRSSRLPVLLRRGGRGRQGSASASLVSASPAAAAQALAAAAVPERTAPPARLSCDYEFAEADQKTIVLRFLGPRGDYRRAVVEVEELHLEGPSRLGTGTIDFQTALSEDAGERIERIVLDRPPTTRIAVWVTYLNQS